MSCSSIEVKGSPSNDSKKASKNFQLWIYSLAATCLMAACVTYVGFMPRASISNIIPAITSAMPEKNEAPGTQRHHGDGWPVRIWSGPPTSPSINRRIPMTVSANPSDWRIYLSSRRNSAHAAILDAER